jgi:transposase
MTRLELTKQARAELEQTFRETPDRHLRDRCQAVLMASRGRKPEDIVPDLGKSLRTIYRWLALYREGGLAGLRITWPPGKEPLIPERLAPTLIKWVKDGPVACGLERANWTYLSLAEHLLQQKGIRVGETAMRDFCHKHGIRPYRPTYRFLRADRAEQARARVELHLLKKGPNSAAWSS